MRLNGDIMRYKGRDIQWWKLRDLWIGSAQEGNTEELAGILREYREAVHWTGGLFGTALYFAAQEGKLEAVELLMNCGAKLGVQENDGVSPLVHAAFHGHADVVRLLLQKGADVDECDTRSLGHYTALAWAAYHGHDEAAKALLQSGADTQIINADIKANSQGTVMSFSISTLVILFP